MRGAAVGSPDAARAATFVPGAWPAAARADRGLRSGPGLGARFVTHPYHHMADHEEHDGADDAPPPPPPIRDRARAALERQLDTLEHIAEDDAADYPHRLRAVEMIAALAGEDLRPRGPKHGPPPDGPGDPHAAAKHAAGKHAPAKHAPGKHGPAKHAAGKHGAAKHAPAKHAAAKRPGGARDEEDDA